MKNLIKKPYIFWRDNKAPLHHFREKEKKSEIKIPFVIKTKMLRKGFLSESFIIYDLIKNNSNDYLPDFHRLKTLSINKSYSLILDDKLIFESTFKHILRIPESYCVIKNGQFMPVGNNSIVDTKSLIEFLKNKSALVLKPVDGGGGVGIYILRYSEKGITINGKLTSPGEINNLISKCKYFYISEFIVQGDYGNNLYPNSINTLRVITMKDPVTNKVFIPIAVQRMGNKTSEPADNWTQGGLSAEVDMETGVLSQGISYPVDGKLEWHSHHPSGNPIEGLKVPHWEEIKNKLIYAAESIHNLKYVGWDVVITSDGFMVLEGNNYSDVNLVQVHRPLLKDDRTRQFYKHYKIIK